MRRRQALQAGLASTLSVATTPVLTSAANSTLTEGPSTRPTQSYKPLSQIEVPGSAEAVVTGDGDTAVVANGEGFTTVDITDPRNPEVLAKYTGIGPADGDRTLGGVRDVVADGDRVAAAGPATYSEDALKGFAVFDVSDPADPTRVGPFTETSYANHNVGFEDGYLYRSGQGGFEVWNVSATPHERVGTWSLAAIGEGWGAVDGEVNTQLHDVTVQDGRAYLAHWNAGCVILDVSDPSSPTFLGRAGDYTLGEIEDIVTGNQRLPEFIETPGNAHYAAVDDDGDVLAVGAEAWDTQTTDRVGGPGGIDLWDVSDPTAPSRLTTIAPPPTPDPSRSGVWTTAHNFELTDGKLYSSWYQGGVKIHDLSNPTTPERLTWWREPREAAFWTARVTTPGETFVASSHSEAGTVDGPGRLYVFPDRAGQQADPPQLVPDDDVTPTDTGTTTPTPTLASTPTQTSSTTTTGVNGNSPAMTTTTPVGDQNTTDGGGLAGFELLAGAVGVSIAVARSLRRRDE